MQFLRQAPQGILLRVHVATRAAKNEIVGRYGQALKIRLQAPPVEGAANAALVQFLANLLDVSARRVELLSGHSARDKTLLIRGLDRSTVEKRLEDLLQPPPRSSGDASRRQ